MFSRYYAICHPTQYWKTKKTNPHLEVLLSFFVALILFIPSMFVWRPEASVIRHCCLIPSENYNYNFGKPFSSVYQNGSNTWLNCFCGLNATSFEIFNISFEESDLVCPVYYQGREWIATDSAAYITYVIFRELLVAIGQPFLSISLVFLLYVIVFVSFYECP